MCLCVREVCTHTKDQDQNQIKRVIVDSNLKKYIKMVVREREREREKERHRYRGTVVLRKR